METIKSSSTDTHILRFIHKYCTRAHVNIIFSRGIPRKSFKMCTHRTLTLENINNVRKEYAMNNNYGSMSTDGSQLITFNIM